MSILLSSLFALLLAAPVQQKVLVAPRQATVNLQGVKLFQIGKRFAFKPFHLAPKSTDKPVVHKMRDLYQEDQKYADLFSKKGQSEICGATAMANVIMYLKHEHGPKYPKLLENEGLANNADDVQVVHKMFQLCHTSKENGTNSVQLKGCAADTFLKAKYGFYDLYVHGVWSDNPLRKSPPGPAMLKLASHSQYAGHNANAANADKGVALLFGWYDRKTYQRRGGHYVALAGYDAAHPETFYVTNPLIDYKKDYSGQWYSKLVLEKAPSHSGLPASGMHQTEHLFGDNAEVIAVLEDMVVVLPSSHGNFFETLELSLADVEGGVGGGSGAVQAKGKGK